MPSFGNFLEINQVCKNVFKLDLKTLILNQLQYNQMITKCNCKKFIKLKNRILAEVGTVQNESNTVPVFGTCSKMYRGTGTRYYF